MNKEKRKNAEIKSLKTELNLFQAAGEALREECYTLTPAKDVVRSGR